MMRWHFLILFLVSFTTSCSLPTTPPSPPLAPSSRAVAERIEVHGHRGARGERPENTLAGFAHALAAGVDVLELDTVVTKDGVVLVTHNPVLSDEICSPQKGSPLRKTLPIIELTLAEAKTFDCGSKKPAKFQNQVTVPGERMPTLDEVFELVKRSALPNAKTVQFNVETKINPATPELGPTPERFAALIVASIRKYHLLSRTILQSFDPRTLVAARVLEPTLRTAFLLGEITDEYLQYGKKINATIISPAYGELTEELIVKMHEQGFKVIPWTVNDPAAWQLLIAGGVDGIITDYPTALINYLKEKGLR